MQAPLSTSLNWEIIAMAAMTAVGIVAATWLLRSPASETEGLPRPETGQDANAIPPSFAAADLLPTNIA